MLKSRIQNVTISVMQDTRVSLGSTELFSIKYRLSHKGIKKYIGTGKHISTDDWNILFTSRKKELLEVRKHIQDGFSNIVNGVEKIFEQRKPFSYELLDQILGNRKAQSINELFYAKVKLLQEEDRTGSVQFYEDALRSIKNFVDGKEIMPHEISVDFLKKYEKWMLDNDRSISTIGMYLRQLRAIMNIAKRNDMITNEEYPFGENKYQIPKVSVQKKSLTKDQIWNIIAKEPIKGEKTRMYRDLWIFTYLANGINTVDLCRLKYSDIYDGEIFFFRKKSFRTAKTKKSIPISISKGLQEIIDRWGNSDKSGYIFPFFYKKKHTDAEEKEISSKLYHSINQTVSRIGKKHGLGRISVYTARHSFAGAMVKSHATMPELQEKLGHNNIYSTAVYFPTTTKEERLKRTNDLY